MNTLGRNFLIVCATIFFSGCQTITPQPSSSQQRTQGSIPQVSPPSPPLKFVSKLTPDQINSEIIRQSFNQTDIDILVLMYAFIWSANDDAFNPPPVNSTRAIGKKSVFFWQKNSIASALNAYENTFNYLGSSIGITGSQFKLALGIQEIIVPSACSNCDPAFKSLRTYSQDINNDMVYRGLVNWSQYLDKPGFKSTPEGNNNPHWELSMGSFFDYYTNFIPEYYKTKALALQQRAQSVERQMAINEDKAAKNRAWLSSPEGRKNTANQELKAQQDRANLQAKIAAEFPYYAVLTCSYGATGGQGNIQACFIGRSSSASTELELRNGSEYGLYKSFEFGKIGEVTNQGFVINLRNNFSITAQNSSDTFTLGLKIYNRANNSVIFNKQVGLYGAIKIKN